MTPARSTLPIALGIMLAACIAAPCSALPPNPGPHPASGIPSGADPQAWHLLKTAFDNRYVLPASFGGMSAAVTLTDNSGIHAGRVSCSRNGDAKIDIPGATSDEKQWLSDQLGSLIAHRLPGSFEQSDGRFPITFGDKSEDELLGTQVKLNDGMGSLYRVHDRTLTEVTREMGGQRFTITVLKMKTVDDGKYLPVVFTVNYFDTRTGALRTSESYIDTYANVNGMWLPQARWVATADKGPIQGEAFTLSSIRILHSASSTASR